MPNISINMWLQELIESRAEDIAREKADRADVRLGDLIVPSQWNSNFSWSTYRKDAPWPDGPQITVPLSEVLRALLAEDGG